jgi:dimethylargininase
MGRGITRANLSKPDYELALEQHREYVEALESAGLEVLTLPPIPEHPDAHFVEDTAVVTPRVAVISRPGAESRRGEEETIEPVLARHRPVLRIEEPGTLDGGDVLATEGVFFVGISERTNEDGARQLGEILERSGLKWRAVPVREGLHLKSGASYLGANTLLVNDSLAGAGEFEGFNRITVAGTEQGAASTLTINDVLFVPSGFPKTTAKLKEAGYSPVELNVSEMQKMDGGLTCLSIRL